MIRVFDANALIELARAQHRLDVRHQAYIPDEIVEELRGREDGDLWLTAQPVFDPHLDAVDYLAAFAHYLNTYPGVSFYSLKGFGDVAILATLRLIVEQIPETPTLSSEVFPWDVINLVTDDRRLRDFVVKEFGASVTLSTLQEFLAP